MATITINSLDKYKGTPLEKAFTSSIEVTPALLKSRLSENLEKGAISQEEHDNALKVVEKLTKGKAANIGETRTWNNKQYKKQASGKWLEVSTAYGKTKNEHEGESKKYFDSQKNKLNKPIGSKEYNEGSKEFELHKIHSKHASKLSDKEYSDEEVGLGEKDKYGHDSKDRANLRKFTVDALNQEFRDMKKNN